MKIIGKTREGYICEVTSQELKKYYNIYYNQQAKEISYKIDDLNVGHTIDLGKGHDFYNDTKYALKQTQEFLQSNAKVINAITNGIKILNTDIGVIEDEK